MYQDEKNEYGCPLYDQSGSVAVKNFASVISQLPPELRTAFETERAARQHELEHFSAEYSYDLHSGSMNVGGY